MYEKIKQNNSASLLEVKYQTIIISINTLIDILVQLSMLSLQSQTFFNLHSAAVDSCFRLSTSSLTLVSDPTFLYLSR